MCVGAKWIDACIVNASSRGLGLQVSRPPQRGTYVEIRKGSHVVVARVVWANGHRFGVCAQDAIDVDLIAAEALSGDKQRDKTSNQASAPKWKDLPKRFDENAERSRFLARTIEFGSLAIAVTVAAAFLFQALQNALVEPLGRVLSGLAVT